MLVRGWPLGQRIKPGCDKRSLPIPLNESCAEPYLVSREVTRGDFESVAVRFEVANEGASPCRLRFGSANVLQSAHFRSAAEIALTARPFSQRNFTNWISISACARAAAR